MNIVRSKAVGPVVCRRPERPAAVRAVVSRARATVGEPSQAPSRKRVNTANDKNSSQANTVQQLCASTAQYPLNKHSWPPDVNLKGRTLSLGHQSNVYLSHDEHPIDTCFRSPDLQIWPRLTHSIGEESLLERAGQDDAYMHECLFSLQADSNAVVHRLGDANISNGTVQLADDHCLFLDVGFCSSLKKMTFRGGSVVVRSEKCRFVNCSFEHCTLVATEGPGFPEDRKPYGPDATEVALEKCKFLCSVLEGAGIGIYANRSRVVAEQCSIDGGWQGVAAHNNSICVLRYTVCRNAALIGVESHGSKLILEDSACDCRCSISLYGMRLGRNVSVCSWFDAREIECTFAQFASALSSDASSAPQRFGLSVFGALLARGKSDVDVLHSYICGYVGTYLQDAKALIQCSALHGYREALLVTHGGECQLDTPGGFESDTIRAGTMRVSGHGSFVRENEPDFDSFLDYDSVLVEKGACACLVKEALPDSSNEGEGDNVSSPRDKTSCEEIVVVSSGKETLYRRG